MHYRLHEEARSLGPQAVIFTTLCIKIVCSQTGRLATGEGTSNEREAPAAWKHTTSLHVI